MLIHEIKSSDKPFGGDTVVFGSDFQQLPFVVSKGARESQW